MEVSFYLKRPKESVTSIYARICYNGNILKYYPGEAIETKHWNKSTQRARASLDSYINFNRRLTNIALYAEDALKNYQNNNAGATPSPELLKAELDKVVKKVVEAPKEEIKVTFVSFIEAFIKESENGTRSNVKTGKPIAPNTIKGYVTVKNSLKDFANDKKKQLDFDSISYDFYLEYTEYLTKNKNFSANTIGKHVQIIKTMLGEAHDRGLHNNLDFKKRKFVVLKEKVDSVYLTEDELNLLEKLDLGTDKKLNRVKDLFLIGCSTGLRFSDLSALDGKRIEGDFIELTQKKTTEKVVIPVRKRVRAILEKYDGRLPKAISNQKMNEYLRQIMRKVDVLKKEVKISYKKGGVRVTEQIQKCELITTHTARRSFATNEFIAGTPSLLIMSITGHKTERAFLEYIKVGAIEKAQLMKVTWEKREKQQN